MQEMANTFRRILIENELGGNLELAWKFSDPDGERTGKSGYSFGVCQFDLNNNQDAIRCLLCCRFTPDEIDALVNQHCSRELLAELTAKLQEHKIIVEQWDKKHICETIQHVRHLTKSFTLGPGTFFHLCDYHNQYFIEPRGKCIRWLESRVGPVEPKDVLDYKLMTLWGRKRPDDVYRRYNNILKILEVNCGS